MRISILILLFFSLLFSSCYGQNLVSNEKLFGKFQKADWHEVFFDSCKNNWKKKWIIDGKKAQISHSEKGMDFHAGTQRKEDASHAVLWSKQSFEGDIKIEYEYTKLEDVIEAVMDISVMLTPVSVILTPLAENGSKNR